MEILNTRTTYEVRAEGNGYTLNGNVSTSANGISEFNVTLTSSEGTLWLNRNYTSDGSFSENMNGTLTLSEGARDWALAQMDAFINSLNTTGE